MTEQRSSLSRQVGEKVVRTTIAIMGLLVLRVILSALPVLNHAAPIYPQVWADIWGLVVAPSQANPQHPVDIESKLRDMFPNDAYQIYLQSLQTALVQEGIKANQGDRTAILSAYQHWLIASRLAIFPITIAHAVIDTLILVLLVFFGLELRNLYRSGYPRFPDLGQLLNLCVLTIVAAIAYVSYQGLLYPLIGADGQQAYDWVFLLVGLAPLLGIVVMGARNMDGLTALVMRSGAGSAMPIVGSIACSCGRPMQPGTKFCPDCGAAFDARPVNASGRNCSICGADNPASARFCKECGRPV
jgi:hypothetical protein